MGSIRKQLQTRARVEDVWAAIRDVGALHTRLVPGFVTDTNLEPGVRIVTFANGLTIREPIVALDEDARRLVWTAVGGRTAHYNASVQAFPLPEGGTSVVWIADFLPDEIEDFLRQAMTAGMKAMQGALDKLAT